MTGMMDYLQELRELGPRATLFRVVWEMKLRSGLAALGSDRDGVLSGALAASAGADLRSGSLPFAAPADVAAAVASRIPIAAQRRLHDLASDSVQGRILCFGRWTADYGNPIDWHLNPTNGRRWDPTAHWTKAAADNSLGDIKYSWEVGRFPQAYHMARSAAFAPERRRELATALAAQIEQFVDRNAYGHGIHWASSQEVVIRLFAWIFALPTLIRPDEPGAPIHDTIAQTLVLGADHVEKHLDYARLAVYNNHLLAEALGLFVVGHLIPSAPSASRWRALGLAILDEQADRQFYGDGAYIQQSHNYHRVALHDLLWACVFADTFAVPRPASWGRAMERSLDFLLAHQNPVDGALPNYGNNDGALAMILSTCDVTDFRATLQAVSVATRQERVYEPGPWDEESAWLFGPDVLDLPLRAPSRRSISFPDTGYHVLRGKTGGDAAAFRCGTVRDRFGQIDMLHLDVWWRGLNVLGDAGSYSYNGPAIWHNYFTRTGCHNTVTVDGRDQMIHYRRFKSLYWTKAKLLHFSDSSRFATCAGEHYGYQRHPGNCIHRRSVLFVKDDLWVVVDRVTGTGTHDVRLHWLCGDFLPRYDMAASVFTLATPAGLFSLQVLDERGTPLAGSVVTGAEDPPRGWSSRYYGEKVAVPSFVVARNTMMPTATVSILGAGTPQVRWRPNEWTVEFGGDRVRFEIQDGLIAVTG